MSRAALIRIGVIGGILLFLILLIRGCVTSPYNNMVSKNQDVKKAWGDVEAQYQRRADLIDNLVETVKGYSKFEKSTLTEIAGLRSQAGQSKVDLGNSNLPIEDKIKAANQVETTMARLMVVFERYPDLKAIEGYNNLMVEMTGTENRVAVARQRYNTAVKEFNSYILTFPNNMIKGIGGFKEMPYFQADKGSEKAPKVKFD